MRVCISAGVRYSRVLISWLGRRRGGPTFPFTAFGAVRRRFRNSMTWPMRVEYTLPLRDIKGKVRFALIATAVRSPDTHIKKLGFLPSIGAGGGRWRRVLGPAMRLSSRGLDILPAGFHYGLRMEH